MKTLATALTLGLALGASALAGPSYYDYSYSAKADYTYAGKNPVPDPAPLAVPCFTAGELHLDLISLYADADGSQLSDGYGGGIGLNYFFTEFVGIQNRAYWWDGDSVIHSLTTSAIVRAPIQSVCLAPYLFGGIGGHFNGVNQFGSHFCARLEFRMTERLGVFADYTRTFADKTDDWDVYSLGLRLAF